MIHKLGASAWISSSKLPEPIHGTVVVEFYVIKKPLIGSSANPRRHQWPNHIYCTKTKLIGMVSIRTLWGTRINKQNVMRMRKFQNTMMNFSLCILHSVYQSLAFGGLLMIGTWSVKLQEANGIGIRAWIHLESWFQNWTFLTIFQVCNGIFSAA